MLEAGEIGVVGFGADVFVAHELGIPFTAGSGEEVMQRFGFQQEKTDVFALVAKSIELFREARLKAHGSASDLWQLQFIISDGTFDRHDDIRRLLMQAHEERIMFVFLVLDAPIGSNTGGDGKGSGEAVVKAEQSILDMMSVEFVDGKVVKRKYIETFPFRYFLVVRDVQDLPGVLAQALRQWFAEVVGA